MFPVAIYLNLMSIHSNKQHWIWNAQTCVWLLGYAAHSCGKFFGWLAFWMRIEMFEQCTFIREQVRVVFACEKVTRWVIERKKESQNRVVVMSMLLKKHISLHMTKIHIRNHVMRSNHIYGLYIQIEVFFGRHRSAQDDLINDSTSHKWMVFFFFFHNGRSKKCEIIPWCLSTSI